MANLTQLKMLEDLHGFLLVDKPEGIAFSTVVKTVKRKFNLVKVGHGGSLDTMASGLMVLLLNDANKFVDRVMGADRAYTGTFKFGETTDTGDKYGRPVPVPSRVMPLDQVKGDQFQVEPRFSAIRKDGAADYEVVDTGDHSQFLAHVYKFVCTMRNEECGMADFSLLGSKGLLPRALAIDLGATLMALRREKVGKFDVTEAVPFAKLLEAEMKDFAGFVMPLSRALA